MNTPKKDGFSSIAETSEHLGTIIMFPERPDIWRNNAKEAQEFIINLANIIIKYENVIMCVKSHLLPLLKERLNKNIKLFEVEYDDIWARDIAPNFIVRNEEIRAVSWEFNSWGGKDEGSYYPWYDDNKFACSLANFLGIYCYQINDIILEGGAVITDGDGTLFTTENVLLNKNRNPLKSKIEIELCLKEYFCCEKVVWLPQGLFLDETNGHIDNLCSIVSPGEICLAWTDDKNDPQYEISHNAYEILANEIDAHDRKFKIHKIILPHEQFITKEESDGLVKLDTSVHRNEGMQLVPSYINYYLINNGLILPIFNCPQDELAIEQMKKIFPKREIIPIYSKEILIGGGGLHCILHEIPYAMGIKW